MATTIPFYPAQSRRSAADSNSSARTFWHKSAPASLEEAFRSGDNGEVWAVWVNHLTRRKRLAAPAELLPGKRLPLGWALADGPDNGSNDGRTTAFLVRIDRLCRVESAGGVSAEEELLAWLADASGSRPEVAYALEALAWCHGLPRLAAVVSSDAWWELLDHLLTAVAEAEQIELDDNPVVHQLLRGELALTLAYLLPEIAPCRKLAREARTALSTGLIELLDGEGLPHARHLHLTRPLLACWTRCRSLGKNWKRGSFTAAARNQYEWLIRQALRLTRHDGSQVLSDGSAGRWCEELFEAALRLGGDELDREIAARVLPRRNRSGDKSRSKPPSPDAALHSEWAATAVLRPGWSRSDAQLTLVYPGRSVRMELGCKRDVLFSGCWECEVRRNGRPLEPTSDWEEVCWVSDKEVDYLELEIELTEGLRVQRQVVMARQDQFLFMADAVLGQQPGRLEYRGCLPLRSDIALEEAKETRDGFLVGRRRRALVMPLALPEWRIDQQVGAMERTERGLELSESSDGSSLYAPLFFDLAPQRFRRPLTWRQLTVAESLEIQPADVAAGYRVMVGKQQWLIYRSLAEKGNRTLLGHNLSTEALIGRFNRDGEVEPLIEIE